MLSSKAIVTKYTSGKKVSGGEAWSLIPYAWSQVKISTLRQCFRSTKVLPKLTADKLEKRSANVQERQPVYPPVVTTDEQQTKQHFLRFIASTLDEHKFDFTSDKSQKDAQDLAEEIRKAAYEKLAMRTALFASRDRSSSVDSDDLTSFEAEFAQERLATKLEECFTSEDPKARAVAQLVIRISIQKYFRFSRILHWDTLLMDKSKKSRFLQVLEQSNSTISDSLGEGKDHGQFNSTALIAVLHRSNDLIEHPILKAEIADWNDKEMNDTYTNVTHIRFGNRELVQQGKDDDQVQDKTQEANGDYCFRTAISKGVTIVVVASVIIVSTVL